MKDTTSIRTLCTDGISNGSIRRHRYFIKSSLSARVPLPEMEPSIS